MSKPLEIIKELHRQAAVEAELVADFLDRLLCCCWSRKINGRVAGQRTGQQKGHDDDAGDDRQRGGEAAQDDH